MFLGSCRRSAGMTRLSLWLSYNYRCGSYGRPRPFFTGPTRQGVGEDRHTVHEMVAACQYIDVLSDITDIRQVERCPGPLFRCLERLLAQQTEQLGSNDLENASI